MVLSFFFLFFDLIEKMYFIQNVATLFGENNEVFYFESQLTIFVVKLTKIVILDLSCKYLKV